MSLIMIVMIMAMRELSHSQFLAQTLSKSIIHSNIIVAGSG